MNVRQETVVPSPFGSRHYADVMTTWAGDPGVSQPALRVVARSEPDRIRVEWDDAAVPVADRPDACAALRRFLQRSHRLLPGLAGEHGLPPQHPHAGELQGPTYVDEHRFLEVRVARLGRGCAWSEPSADERGSGAQVEPCEPAPAEEYGASSFRFGPDRGEAGVAEGPVVPLAELIKALAAEIDHRT